MHCSRHLGVLTFFVIGALALSQIPIDEPPNERAVLKGSKTVLAYRLSQDARTVTMNSPTHETLIRLPSVARKAEPKLLGLLNHKAEIELFLGWVDPESKPGDFEHHIEIFRGRRGSEAVLVHVLTLIGGPTGRVSFFQPPDTHDAEAVLVDIQGGAYWGTTYLLAPDRQSVEKLFDAVDYQFADLDRDGIYELIAWDRRPFDMRCNFGIFGVRIYPEIFIRSGASYRKAWPPSEWVAADGQLETPFKRHETDFLDYQGVRRRVPWDAEFQIMAGFANLAADGVAELIVLQDRLRDDPAQMLAIYRLERGRFRLVAQTSLPPQRVAYLLLGIRNSPRGKEILVRTATPAKCEAGGIPEGSQIAETAYILDRDRLRPAQSRSRKPHMVKIFELVHGELPY